MQYAHNSNRKRIHLKLYKLQQFDFEQKKQLKQPQQTKFY